MRWESKYEYLEHHGIKGQRWGRRNYQNEDGTLTAAGRARYGVSTGSSGKNGGKKLDPEAEARRQKRRETLKKIAKDVGMAAVVGVGAYAAKKAFDKSTNLRDEMRRKAQEMADEASWDKNVAKAYAQREIFNSKLARDDKRLGINPDSVNNRRSAFSQKYAHEYFKAAKHYLDLEKKYTDIAKNTTRHKAVTNYLLNKGHISINDPSTVKDYMSEKRKKKAADKAYRENAIAERLRNSRR